MQTISELVQLIKSHHKPELALRPGMVYQIWEDDEISLQKSGDLLWQRTLHQVKPGLVANLDKSIMPEQNNTHGYAYIKSVEIGSAIRQAMLEFAKLDV